MDNNLLAIEAMSRPPNDDMDLDQVDDSDKSGNGTGPNWQDDDFPDTQVQERDPSALDAIADELEQEAEAEERLAQEVAMRNLEVQELDTQEDAMDIAAVPVTNEDRDTVMQSVEQEPSNGPDIYEPSDMGAQLADFLRGQPQQYDPDSLFVPEHEPSPGAVPAAPSILSATPAAQPRKPFSFDRIREFQVNLQRLKTASKKPVSNGFTKPLLNPAARQEANFDSDNNNTIGMDVHRPAPDVDEDEKFHKQAAAKYQKLKRYYDGLREQNNGELNFRHQVEWLKIQQAEGERKNKRKRDLERAREEDGHLTENLFPEDLNDDEEEDEDDNDEPRYGGEGSSRKRPKPDLPRKEIRPPSLLDAEIRSMKVMIDADRDLPKRKPRKQGSGNDGSQYSASSSSKSSKSKGKGKGKGKAKGNPTKSSKGGARTSTAKEKKDLSNGLRQATSLLTGNVFNDQAAADAPEQPGFTSKNKKDALKELIASVPLESQKAARVDMNTLIAASRDFTGRGSVMADGGLWKVKGMKTSLKPYQLLGAAFMRRREGSVEEPRGGLMADQMGLGKTLMMLANIVNGRPAANAAVRTTLLVASPSLLSQWDREVEMHTACKPGLKVMRYNTGNRLDSNQLYEIIRQHDIVLTTYTEVMRSYPKNQPPVECHTAEQKIAWWKETYLNMRGVLHRMQFHRIVLDEAQAIKNHTGRTSIACRALMADHRWALSGTPILNSLTELYPYFRFLNVPHTGSFKIFKNNYCDKKCPENASRLLLRLNQFMIRRTHSDKMFDAPILKLPRASQVTHWCEFNSIERNIYDIVRDRFAKCINMWSQKGELGKSYSNALVMLLRLRQLTAHVLMLQFVMRDLLEREDIERIREVVRDNSSTDAASQQAIIVIREQLADLAKEETRNAETEANSTHDGEDGHEGGLEDGETTIERNPYGGSFGTEFDFQPYINSLTTGDSWEKAKKKAICSTCRKRPTNPWLTQCNHLLCSDCYEDAVMRMAEQNKEGYLCTKCGQTGRTAYECNANGELDDSQQGYGTRSKTKKKQKARPEQEDIQEDWLSLGGGKMLPSAKTIAIKAQILNWVRENPDVKIIIYTQFLAMIRILDKACAEEDWGTEQYHGKLSLAARDKAISRFADDPDVRVLLASLRCGALGLNLTMASRVIIIDPWWNAASEQQAFCRVFRIGQTDTTFMTRFCVKNTVDERLIEMQERKQDEIDEVMEDDGERIKKMSIRDLMRLFGPVDEDSDGKPFIMVDDPISHGGFKADKDDEGYADED